MRRIILETPWSTEQGEEGEHVRYVMDCLSDCLMAGEAPLVPLLLYTQSGVLDGDIPAEHAMGLAASRAWLEAADALVVYVDYGLSEQMREAMTQAESAGVRIEVRSLRFRGGRLPCDAPAVRESVS